VDEGKIATKVPLDSSVGLDGVVAYDSKDDRRNDVGDADPDRPSDATIVLAADPEIAEAMVDDDDAPGVIVIVVVATKIFVSVSLATTSFR